MNYPPEVQEALDKAVKKYGPNLEGALPANQQFLAPDVLEKSGMAVTPEIARKIQRRLVKAIGWPQYAAAFKAGQKAKHQGFASVSPYYECKPLDDCWFAGYYGMSLEQALQVVSL